jgi:hypothetical protein
MNLWSRIKAYKDKNYVMPEIDYHALSMFPPQEGFSSTADSVSMQQAREMRNHLEEFKRRNPEFDLSNTRNLDTTMKFIRRKMFWMKRGLKPDAAYQKVADEYAPTLERERRFATMVAQAAKFKQAQSFMDHYEQLAHYEGIVKVKQLTRELNKFVRSQNEENEDDGVFDTWEGLNVKVIADDIVADEIETDHYISKAVKLKQIHAEKDTAFDGLRGLNDNMILWNSKESSTAIHKNAKQLLSVLKEAGITLNEHGEIDASSLGNSEVEKAIRANPLAKVVLETEAELRLKGEKDYIERRPLAFSTAYDGPGKLINWGVVDPYKRYFENLNPEQIETVEQRHQRLEEAWLARKPNEEDQLQMQDYALDALQEVRRKIDQILAVNGQEPIYTKQNTLDLLTDASFNLEKMDEYLTTPKEELIDSLYEDKDYEMINFITEPKILEEDTVKPFYDRDFSYNQHEQDDIEYDDEDPEKKIDGEGSDDEEYSTEDDFEAQLVEDEEQEDDREVEDEGRRKKKPKENKKSRMVKAFTKLADKTKAK